MNGLLSIFLVGISSAVLSAMLNYSMSGQKSMELGNDLEILRRQISATLACAATMAGVNPAAPGTNCNSNSVSQVGPFLRLYRVTANGQSKPMSSDWNASDGTQKIGSWTVRATCSENDQTLVIRAARLGPGGIFLKDPMSGKVQDWTSKQGLLFGSTNPVCFNANMNGPIGPGSAGVRVVSAIGGLGPNSIATANCNANESFVWGDCQCHQYTLWLSGFYGGTNGQQCACTGNHSYTGARAYCYSRL